MTQELRTLTTQRRTRGTIELPRVLLCTRRVSWPSDLGRRLARADYAGRRHNPRLAVHDETEVTVRRDKGVENVIRSRTENLKAL